MTKCRFFTFVTSVAVVFLVSPHVFAAENDQKATTRLQALVAAYKALPAYSDQGTIEYEMKVANVAKVETVATPIAFARPNRLKVSTPLVEIVSDGKSLITTVPALKTYFKSAVPSKLTHNDLTEGPLGAFERGGLFGMPMRVMLTLILDDNPVAALERDATGFAIEKPTTIDKVTYEGIRIESDTAPSMVLWIDPESKLVSQIEVKLAERASGDSAVPDVPVDFGSFRWKAGKIETKAPASFESKPAADFKEVVSLDARETKKSEHALVGKAAPDYTLNLLEKGGKTRRITSKELLGKVVLIDFWAMWCGPCRKEMPDIAKLSEDLARAKVPVVVVALSIDQPEEADLVALEKKVRADILGLGYDIEKAETRMLALDPSGTTARSFGVNAIPTMVLLDAKGVVRAVHVGMTEREVLAKQIEALVAGKEVPGR